MGTSTMCRLGVVPLVYGVSPAVLVYRDGLELAMNAVVEAAKAQANARLDL
jgi:hypothetical protein